ncbi:hypothetical protein [Parabacteroides bouchesdurhonensis]|nr:hypothetical protein [Parabacteroides bouchesdurhonensis]
MNIKRAAVNAWTQRTDRPKARLLASELASPLTKPKRGDSPDDCNIEDQ